MNTPIRYESLASAQLTVIQRSMSPIQRMLLDLSEINPDSGAGILGPTSKCVWLSDGRRVTFSMPGDGGLIASTSKEPDPLADPKNRVESGQ